MEVACIEANVLTLGLPHRFDAKESQFIITQRVEPGGSRFHRGSDHARIPESLRLLKRRTKNVGKHRDRILEVTGRRQSITPI